MIYNWQKKDWPDFFYDLKDLDDLLFSFAEETGNIAGILLASPEQKPPQRDISKTWLRLKHYQQRVVATA